jgi:hypothetical protein
MEESKAVAASSSIPENPMNPSNTIIDAINGTEPVIPPLNDLNTIDKSRNTVTTAKRSENICPLIMELAKSVINRA